jgi:hypothetical protein
MQSLADKGDDNYLEFTVKKGTPKERLVQLPKPILEQVHVRTFKLLQRIHAPDYLHSGTRGRSYLTNALQHVNGDPLIKLDIKKFYPSTQAQRLYHTFVSLFEIAPDAAGLLTKLLTFNNHVPTGSCASQVVAFFSNYYMFEEIVSLCRSRGLVMTVYVDDITVSGPSANEGMVRKIGKIVNRHGLDYHKVRVFAAHEPKIVTGVVVTGQGLRVQNCKRKAVHEQLIEVRQNSDDPEVYKMCVGLLGRVTESAQIEGGFAELLAEVRSIRHKLIKLGAVP